MLPSVGEIKSRRKRAGLTQKEIAAMAGVSQSLIAKIESGQVRPTYENVRKIIEALDNLEKKDTLVAKDIMSKNVTSIKKNDVVENAINTMRRSGYSQLPVLERGHSIGTISEKTIVDVVSNGKNLSQVLNKKVEEVMEESLPTVHENESMDTVSALLKTNTAVLVTKGGKALGIIAKADLFKIVKKK
jgi:predicted transcriptional regulator